MLRLLNRICLSLLIIGAVEKASAFALFGPLDTWQTANLGYDGNGGPQNLGEEYRINTPTLTYGFDSAFLNYFGTNGVADIDQAMKLLNDLPSFRSMTADLNEYPNDTRRINYQANALQLYSLKSYALSAVLGEMGLAGADRYVWCIRNIYTDPANVLWYTIIKRNFDPVTWEYSSYVNGAMYTYQIAPYDATPDWDAMEYETDPNMPSDTAVSSLADPPPRPVATGSYITYSYGMFYSGLTRDDVGGLRYLYDSANWNVETLPTNAVAAGLGLQTGIIGGGTTGGNPWGQPPGGTTTNTTGTNTVTVTNVVVGTATRPGVDHITFVRVNYDSAFGVWVPLTNVWTDTYITNYASKTQTLQRTLTQPDILFTAADMGVDPVGQPILWGITESFINNSALNAVGTTGGTLNGPGLVAMPAIISFNKVGPWWYQTAGGNGFVLQGFLWGTFDGTTNAPIVYPSGISIKALEQAIITGQAGAGQNPYLNPAGSTASTGQTGP